MEFETPKDRKLQEDLDRMFGKRESAKDMRQAIFMARKGLINDEAIAAYVRYKEQERQEYLEVMTEENPDYAFKTGEELLSLVKLKEADAVNTESGEGHSDAARDSEHGGDKDAISEH